MVHTAKAQDRLRDYLLSLPAPIRSRLASVAADAVAAGSADPALRLIASTLAPSVPAESEGVPIGPVLPVFARFQAFIAPFIAPVDASGGFTGFFSRNFATHIWEWLVALAGEETEAALARSQAAVSLDVAEKADSALLARMADDLESVLAKAATNRTLAFQIQTELGSVNTSRELGDLSALFRTAPLVACIRRFLPEGLDKIDEERADRLMRLLVAVPPERLWVAAASIAASLVVPARVAALAARLEGTDAGQRIARGRWSQIVDVAITLIAMSAAKVASAPKRGDLETFLAGVREAYLAIQTVTRAIEVESWPAWRERIADSRKRISDRLGGDLAELPVLLRQTVRAYIGGDEAARVDQTEIEDVLRLLRLLYSLKAYRGELAVSELVDRMLRLVEPLMENANQSLLSVLRSAPGAHRERAAAGFDTLMSFSAIVFGEEYAGLLRRSAHMASDGLVRDASREQTALAG
ncbi:MAG: hypothetical protein H6883_00855 [Rhodobiaceae bacterium]|nr:hypothetical protein [Rhodobiaceae bacterium]MCC0054666.1 hypothetical protein [Rhodobiaceae bacterium]